LQWVRARYFYVWNRPRWSAPAAQGGLGAGHAGRLHPHGGRDEEEDGEKWEVDSPPDESVHLKPNNKVFNMSRAILQYEK
jgi:hypothetical protein